MDFLKDYYKSEKYEIQFLNTYFLEGNSNRIGKFSFRQTFDFFLLLLRINKKTSKNRIFHFHTSRKLGLVKDLTVIGLVAFLRPKFKILIHIHHSDFDKTFPKNILLKRFCLYILKYQNIISLTTRLKNQLEYLLPKSKIFLLPNFYTVNHEGSAIKNLEKRKNLNFFFVGSIDQRKNWFTLVKKLAELKKDYDIKFTVYGAPQSKANKNKLIRYLEKYQFIDFRSYVEENAIFQSLSPDSIFIQPSASEGMSIALLNAISNGFICISTNVDSVVELNDRFGESILTLNDDLSNLNDLAYKIMMNQYDFDEIKKRMNNISNAHTFKLFQEKCEKIYNSVI
ncbi:MAG: glycosyltransferase [Bacteroidota bacterium]|nr:glycosyltransferase [Bacteroidota bacterium]MEC8739281.1 glycosyltransferase [Bacteroidota bacterium]